MERSTFQVLLVDDYEPWRAFVASTLKNQAKLRIIGEARDGLEAVQIAQQLQPDLILLDIGLPTLNGIEAARRIREVSPKSKILFVSENRSRDIAEEALRTGACGYVVKAAAANELLPAVEAVLHDKRFVSASLTGSVLGDLENKLTAHDSGGDKVITRTPPQSVETARNHEVGFYSDQRLLLENVTQFIGAALDAGNAAIVVATESHRDSLLSRLEVRGLDIGAAIKQGRLTALDAADVLSAFLLNGMPDPALFMKTFWESHPEGCKGGEGGASGNCYFRRMCASPLGRGQCRDSNCGGKTRQSTHQGLRSRYSVWVFCRPGRDGWPHLSPNLCRAFSCLFLVKKGC